MNPVLPDSFLSRPIAHRALHDADEGRPENSMAAIRAAVSHGYGIEIDVQLTADEKAAVFHDYDINRLTLGGGAVQRRNLAELATIRLTGSKEHIPGLGEVLDLIDAQVPLLIEIKDQDRALGSDVGALENAVAEALDGYKGPVAVMSFNPHSVAAMQALIPDVPRGLVTCTFADEESKLAADRQMDLANIVDFARVGASFISHDVRDLKNPRVAELKSQGTPILCWTVRSPEEDRAARKVADNVTFEGYLPPLSA